MTLEQQIEKLIEDFESQSKQIAKEIDQEADGIKEDSEVLTDNGTLFKIKNGDATYNFEWKKVSFNVPEITMSNKEQNVILKLPEVTMEIKSIVFNVPYTIMVDKKIGEKPEVTCKWKIKQMGPIKTKVWQCTTKMTPIITAVPEVHQKRHEIVTKIPQVTFSNKELKFNTPSVTIKMKPISFNSLVITSINYDKTENNVDEASNEINAKQAELNSLTTNFESQIEAATIQMISAEFDKAEDEVRKEFKPISDTYSESITNCKNAIRDLKNNNAFEALKQEEEKLNSIISEMNTALAPMEKILSDMLKNRLEAIESVRNMN